MANVEEVPCVSQKTHMCIDMRKSYATFFECRYYEQEKFPSKFTDLRPTDRLMGPGMYLVGRFDFSNAPEQLRRILKMWGEPYRDLNVYPRPDLVMLQDFGVTFDVLEGAWADGHKPYFDFRFPGEAKNDAEGTEATGFYRKDIPRIKDTGPSYFAKWA
eukprot:5073795-Prymnesium_polylepis.1